MTEWINWLFLLCCDAIYWLEAVTGISYEAWNLILFVFLQPLLILVFFCLWLRERFVRCVCEMRCANVHLKNIFYLKV